MVSRRQRRHGERGGRTSTPTSASADYRKAMIPVFIKRAVESARA